MVREEINAGFVENIKHFCDMQNRFKIDFAGTFIVAALFSSK